MTNNYLMSSGLGSWIDRIWNPINTECMKTCCAFFFAASRIRELRWWLTPQRVFVGPNSLFSNYVPDIVVRDLLVVMGINNRHTFKVLAKNPDRMEQWFGTWAASEAEEKLAAHGRAWPPDNVQLGIRVTDQHSLDVQLSCLLGTPAAKRIVVIDPLRSSIDLTHVECPTEYLDSQVRVTACGQCKNDVEGCRHNFNALTNGIDQVVLGCDHLTANMHWAKEIADQCWTYGVNIQHIRGPHADRDR